MNSEVEKLKALKINLKKMKRVAVAYSGGVDSTFLVKAAVDTLGRDNVLAIMAVGLLWTEKEMKQARMLAKSIGVKIRTIKAPDITQPAFSLHIPERCYFCKRDIFTKLIPLAEKNNFYQIADGTNKDDLSKLRPGLKVLRELKIRSPLAEVGLTKNEVRSLSKSYGLTNWDKPSRACLATRFPFGTPVTPKRLIKIAAAEMILEGKKIKDFLCYFSKESIRIQVSPRDLSTILSWREEIVKQMKKIGFRYVTLDLESLP